MAQDIYPAWLHTSKAPDFFGRIDGIKSAISVILSAPKIVLISVAIIFFGLLTALSGMYVLLTSSQSVSATTQPVVLPEPAHSAQLEEAEVFVIDVGGAVVNPGVYLLPSESRVEAAVVAAGGFSDQVDKDYVSRELNLARSISNQQKLYIPFESERDIERWCQQSQSSHSSADTVLMESTKISINNATESQLEELPGIGSVRAKAIIDGRPYSSIEALTDTGVLTQNQFEKIQLLIVL